MAVQLIKKSTGGEAGVPKSGEIKRININITTTGETSGDVPNSGEFGVV